jgi:hypothetical protein
MGVTTCVLDCYFGQVACTLIGGVDRTANLRMTSDSGKTLIPKIALRLHVVGQTLTSHFCLKFSTTTSIFVTIFNLVKLKQTTSSYFPRALVFVRPPPYSRVRTPTESYTRCRSLVHGITPA